MHLKRRLEILAGRYLLVRCIYPNDLLFLAGNIKVAKKRFHRSLAVMSPYSLRYPAALPVVDHNTGQRKGEGGNNSSV